MFSQPPCTLAQPSMHASADDNVSIPDFGKNFCPPIYPLGDDRWKLNIGSPLISLHAFQLQPSPAPPSFASKTVIDCQSLMIYLQEESCMRISSFLADGIVSVRSSVLPDSSINSLMFSLKGLDVTVPLEIRKSEDDGGSFNTGSHGSFAGATLHIENLYFSESPSLKLGLLNLEKDAACFCLWEGQPIDASQKKWTSGASLISLSLDVRSSPNAVASGLWRCLELKGACLEAAMATPDGRPLATFPPPGGIVRVGIACQQYLSNTSVEQLFFVLDLYSYFGRVSEKIVVVGKSSQLKEITDEPASESLRDNVPADTAVSVSLKVLRLRFLESSSIDIEGVPLVQFVGDDLFIKVGHRTLGGAMVISSSVRWESVEVDCADTESNISHENGSVLASGQNNHLAGNGCPEVRAVFWIQNKRMHHKNVNIVSVPFLDVRVSHMIPFDVKDAECHSLNISACVSGVRLGGGMTYAEALLHRFGILGPDGGPGVGLNKGVEQLSAGPLSKLFKAPPSVGEHQETKNNGDSVDYKDNSTLSLGVPDDVNVLIELKDWLFALEGAQEISDRWRFYTSEDAGREDRCWHTSFQNMLVKAKSSQKNMLSGEQKYLGVENHPFELVTVGVEGLQILKPLAQKTILESGVTENGHKQAVETHGVNAEVDIVISQDEVNNQVAKWIVDNLKFSVKHPIEAVVTKDELQYLAILCKSEVESMGRIVAGILRVLRLEGSIGPAAMNQLSNLGREGFDNIFTGEKLSGVSSASNITGGSRDLCLESTLTSLDEMVLNSKATCTALTSSLQNPESSPDNLANVKQLTQKLESMQKLLMQLRTQI